MTRTLVAEPTGPIEPTEKTGSAAPPLARRFSAEVLAAVALTALGLRQFLAQGLTSGCLLALLLLPVWVLALARFRGARLFVSCGVLALLSGEVLSVVASTDHSVSRGIGLNSLTLLLGVICGVGVILWARTVLSTVHIGLFIGLGMLLGLVALPSDLKDNPWKYGYAIPVAIIALSLTSSNRHRGRQLAVLLGLALLSGIFDSRSYMGTLFIAAVLLVWQMRPQTESRRTSWTRTVLFLLGLSAAVYYLGSTLLVDGYLGQAAQQRSVEQIDTAGSLILGGRPELAATAFLVAHRPEGFGSGVVPNLQDVLVAKSGMAAINYDPNNGYVESFMFGGHFELHSVVGDLWVTYGLAGVLLVVVMAALVIRSLAEGLAHHSASGLLLFLGCYTLWNLFFSPLYSSAPVLMVVLGLFMVERGPSSRVPAPAWR